MRRKSEKGAITLFVLIAGFSFITFLIAMLMAGAAKRQTQAEATKQARYIYSEGDANTIYNEYFGEGAIPIYTKAQLDEIGSDHTVTINENGGKRYTFSNNAVYVLMNDLSFEYNGIWNFPTLESPGRIEKNGKVLTIQDTRCLEMTYYYYSPVNNYEVPLNDCQEPYKTMLLNGAPASVTRRNYASHLGKIVTNYVGPSSVTVGSNTYNVSSQYRLYYIDWDNKYGDGAGTIYLKADVTNNRYALQTPSSSPASLIQKLCFALYENGKTPPSNGNNNMKATMWLIDPTVWSGLTTGLPQSITNKINYVVGAPGVEMMTDSYNLYYTAKGEFSERELMKTEPEDASHRTSYSPMLRLFFRYRNGKSGYDVGPANGGAYTAGTSAYMVKNDSTINTTYYPGSTTNSQYWLASPSSWNNDCMMGVLGTSGGLIYGYYGYYATMSFCPLVSLQPDVQL